MLKGFLGSIFRLTPKTLRRLFSRLMNPRFSVTAGAVVTDDQGPSLLLKHVFRAGSGWGIPGGFIQAGEQPEEAVRRELREEVGLELERAEIAFIRTLRSAPNRLKSFFIAGPKERPNHKALKWNERPGFRCRLCPKHCLEINAG